MRHRWKKYWLKEIWGSCKQFFRFDDRCLLNSSGNSTDFQPSKFFSKFEFLGPQQGGQENLGNVQKTNLGNIRECKHSIVVLNPLARQTPDIQYLTSLLGTKKFKLWEKFWRLEIFPRFVFWTFPRFSWGRNWKPCFRSQKPCFILKTVIFTDFSV